jgi:transposase
VAGFISEWWPESNRNGGRHQIGIPGRIASEFARKIDRFVDLSEVRAHLGPYYSDVGRPSIDPELMIRMLIVGYGFGIRSERRLCEEVHLNLAYRWFCRLGLDADVPNHSTFSKNRHGGIVTSALFTCQTRQASVGSDEQNQ